MSDVKDLSRIKTGKKGEEIAVRHLQKLGYRILERNYRCPLGEIDVVARDKDTIVFVEVKSRKTEEFGDPELAVGKAKQKKMSLLSLYYLSQQAPSQMDARFDVVAVKMLSSGTEVKLFRNAFDLAES
jgi:putative endonuclease